LTCIIHTTYSVLRLHPEVHTFNAIKDPGNDDRTFTNEIFGQHVTLTLHRNVGEKLQIM